MEFVAADLAALRAVAANASVLAALERMAGSDGGREDAPPWVVGGYVVTTHPDLVLLTGRLAEAAGGSVRFAFGRPIAVGRTGEIAAVGIGVFDLVVRLAEGPPAVGVEGRPRESFGPGWWTLPVGVAGVPHDTYLARIAEAIGDERPTRGSDADA